jgi:hypothetical protein
VVLIRRVNFKGFYVPVGVILPVFNGKPSANVDVNWAPGVVRLCLIGVRAWLTLDCHEPVS